MGVFMSDELVALKKLVADATVVLREAESSLQQLVQTALANHEQLLADQQQNGHSSAKREAAVRLEQISQQLSKFSEHSKSLQIYLQNGLEAPLTYDGHWSRIRILQSQEEERAQLARSLESGVGQLLANAVFELASCRHLLANDTQAVSAGLDALQQELEQGLADIRHFITDLEPAAILNNFGLGDGIRRYLEQYEARTQIKAELRINTNLGRLPSLVEVAIFRVIQEALLNVYRHARASRLEVVFEEKDNMMEFSVIDDGQGFASERIDMSKKNLGLARMVDYAALLNGKLRIFSEPNQGTRVVLSVPYQAL
jgi:two-component system sensor histidine kinase DegS